MSDFLDIDGAMGEGGGQVLRSSLSLSVITQRPIRIVNIRANRDRPGLRPQHLVAVRSAARISNGILRGDRVGIVDHEARRDNQARRGDQKPGTLLLRPTHLRQTVSVPQSLQ